ncbi:hypothetical protein [Amycolatopsis suaedae]|uniref:SdpA family antimicrobial peptide system protein n=1 Tax=Amycolatopsis suaedae TaxID=2510978 RepID=A0A4V2ELB9_9PSEU|nr:hypothetical protein [Amycolatopsis suaedae]RZQ61025.1 hypothetical protein EWH70_26545 [Amycolatopsis suaedae]
MLVALSVVFAVTLLLQVGAPQSTSAWWARQVQTASLIWHQDWRVFTRAPIGPDTVVYDARDLTSITMYATSAGNRWGLSRNAYTLWMETAALDDVVPANRWHVCVADVIQECQPVLASIPAVAVANPTLDATMCGRVVFSRETPIAWRDAEPATGRTRRIDSVTLLDVTCGR